MAISMLKVSFTLTSVLCALLSIALAGGGVWFSLKLKMLISLRNYETYQLDATIRWPEIMPYIFAVVGVFGILVVFCGLSGIWNKGCLLTYAACGGFFLLAAAAAGVAAKLLAIANADEYMKEMLKSAFDEARFKPAASRGFAEMEQAVHCCGLRGAGDYRKYGFHTPLPASCCDQGVCTEINYRRGCIDVVTHWTYCAYNVGLAGCGSLATLALISVVLAVILIRTNKEEENGKYRRPDVEETAICQRPKKISVMS